MKSKKKATGVPLASTLGYALLGLLARGEQSGYALTQGLKTPVGFFWHAGHSQIYPELARLEAAGLVRHTVVAQSERPDKKVFCLTDAGQEALVAWLSADTEVPRARDELVLKAYTMWRADRQAAAQMVRQHMDRHRVQQEAFERQLRDVESRAGHAFHDPASPWFGTQAALRRGIGYEREYAEWCAWLVTMLEHLGTGQLDQAAPSAEKG